MYKKVSLTIGLYTGLCVILFFWYRFEMPVFKSFFSDSDVLYLPILFKNLLEQHGSIKDWYLTPAPYFFPDFLIFLPAYVFGKTIAAQMVLCAWFQMTLLGVVCYYFFKSLFNLSRITAVGSALFAVTLLFGLALQISAEPTPFSYLLVASFHYGAFLTEVVCLILLILLINNQNNNRLLIALSGLAFIITVSDTIFIVQYVLPMILSLFFMRTHRIQLLLPIGLSAIGFLIYPALVAHPTRYPNQPGFGAIISNFHEIEKIFYHLFQTIPLAVVFLFIFYVILAGVLQVFIIRKSHSSQQITPCNGLVFLSFFTLFSMISSIAAMLFITHFIPTSRYFISIVSLPIIITIGCISIVLKKRAYVFMMSGVFVILSVLAFQLIDFYQKGHAHSTGYYSQDIACIDESLAKYPSLQHGIGQYWDAKMIQAFSRRHLIIAQHEKKLQERRWITSDSFFQPMYDFAVVNMKAKRPDFVLSLDTIAKYNHPPLERIQCGKYVVLIYSKNTLQIRPIVQIGDRASWKGSELFSLLGHPTNDGAMLAEQIKTSGFVTYGPYALLSEGLYQFEISYRSSKPKNKQAGVWDVVSSDTKQMTILTTGVLYGSAGETKRIQGTFQIVSGAPTNTIEIRTKAWPGKWFQVNQLIIKRIT